MRVKRPHLNALRRLLREHLGFILLGVAVAIGLPFAAAALAQSLVREGYWPVTGIAGCEGDLGCTASVVLTDGALVLIGGLWGLAIAAVLLLNVVFPPPKDEMRSVERVSAEARTARGQRIALRAGRLLVFSAVGFTIVLLAGSATGRIIARATWPERDIERCEEATACVVSILPHNALPVWFAFGWLAIVIAATVICWKPVRWWAPSSAGESRARGQFYTSPFWIARHANTVAVVSWICLLGVFDRGQPILALEYIWVILAAFTLFAVATLSKRIHRVHGPGEWILR